MPFREKLKFKHWRMVNLKGRTKNVKIRLEPNKKVLYDQFGRKADALIDAVQAASVIEIEKALKSSETEYAFRVDLGNESIELKGMHFGVGELNWVNALEVRWPCGKVQTLHNIAVNKTYTFTETKP